jgi:hypothetical protein
MCCVAAPPGLNEAGFTMKMLSQHWWVPQAKAAAATSKLISQLALLCFASSGMMMILLPWD